MSFKDKFDKHIYRAKRIIGREELKLYMDVSPCNLRCSVCPRGGLNALRNDIRAMMSFDTFGAIIDKFKAESVKIRELEFGSWGDPLLNPNLPKMIRYVADIWPPKHMGHKGLIGVSTNLNCLKDAEELILSGITRIRISISGMTQETYSRNHVGGNIETVLRNIKKLTEARNKHNLREIAIGIGYHDLVYNKHEIDSAKRFCEDNGLFFVLMQMYITSIEDNVIFHRDRDRMAAYYGKFIDIDSEIGRMKLADRRKVKKCQFRRSVIVVNSDATISRCASIFESKNVMGSIFDYKIRDIPRINSPMCEVCADTPMSWR